MRLRALSLVGTLAVALSAAGAAGAATSVVYSDPTVLPGNQPWTYDLGQDFTVNKAVTVYTLGAFTNGGANSNIEVSLFKLTDANPSDGGSLVSSTLVTGSNIVGDYAFEKITPVTLTPGTYQLQSFGGGGDNNFNTGFTANPNTNVLNFDTLGGALTQGADFYDGGGTSIATTSDPHWYAAASFMAAVPEPSVWLLSLAGVGLVGAMLRSNRRGVAAALA